MPFVICNTGRHNGPIVGAMRNLPVERCDPCKALDFKERR